MARKYSVSLGEDTPMNLQCLARTLDTSTYRRQKDGAKHFVSFCSAFPRKMCLHGASVSGTRNSEGNYQLIISFTPNLVFSISFLNSSEFGARISYTVRDKGDTINHVTKGTTKPEKVIKFLEDYISETIAKRVRVRRKENE